MFPDLKKITVDLYRSGKCFQACDFKALNGNYKQRSI